MNLIKTYILFSFATDDKPRAIGLARMAEVRRKNKNLKENQNFRSSEGTTAGRRYRVARKSNPAVIARSTATRQTFAILAVIARSIATRQTFATLAVIARSASDEAILIRNAMSEMASGFQPSQ